MEYYKIIYNNTIVGVATSSQFVRYSLVNNNLLYCSKNKGQYIIYDEKLYRDSWMKPLSQSIDYIEAEVLRIDEVEYHTLYEALKTNEEITVIEIEDEPIEEEEEVIAPSITVEFIRSSKLNEMSYQCKKTIENGFDLELRGTTHHFSLTTQDQLNLISLGTMAQTSNEIPYHADGEEVIFYTSEEINQIIAAANAFKTYQTTYYNSLKAYINSLETIEEISAIEYGIEIPEKFKTEVLKALEHK